MKKKTTTIELLTSKGLVGGYIILLLSAASSVTVPKDVRYGVLTLCTVLAMSHFLGHRKSFQRNTTVPAAIATIYIANLAVTVWKSLPITLYALIALAYLSLAYLCSTMVSEDIRRLKICIVLVAIVETVLASIESIKKIPPIPWGYNRYATGEKVILANPFSGDGAARAEGSMGHPIVLGMLLLVAILLLVLDRPFERAGLAYMALPILSYGLWLSGTRSAVLALAIGAILGIASKGTTKLRLYLIYIISWVAVLFLAFDFGLSRIIANLLDSGSYTNRAQALAAVPGLFDQDFSRILLGNGFGSENRLYAEGLLQQNGFKVVDNQLVTLLATAGLLGALLIVALMTASYLRGRLIDRSLIAAMAVMMFSFDYLRWPAAGALLFFALSMAWGSGPISESDPTRIAKEGAKLSGIKIPHRTPRMAIDEQ